MRCARGAGGAGADSCEGRTAIGSATVMSGTGLAAAPTGQSWQWPSCSWFAGALAPVSDTGTAMFFMPELVQISVMIGDLSVPRVVREGSAILNKTAISTVQASGN